MKIVIVGSGMAGSGLFLELQKLPCPFQNSLPGALNSNWDVTLVTADSEGYYSRPLLSHGFADPKIPERIVLKMWNDMLAPGFQVRHSTRALSVDVDSKKLIVENAEGSQEELTYDKLVLATGSEAFVPPSLRIVHESVFVLNNLSDLHAVRAHREAVSLHGQNKWAVVGGGYIGCEVASDFAKAGDEVALYQAEPRLAPRALAPHHSAQLQEHLQNSKIDVRCGVQVSSVVPFKDGRLALQFANGETSPPATGLLIAAGFIPRTQLAVEGGLQLGTPLGIWTDSFLRTSGQHVYALGDVAAVEGNLYPFVAPVRSQVKWLAEHFANREASLQGWQPPLHAPSSKCMASALFCKSDFFDRSLGLC